jgi:molecular chaperone GrpE
MSEPTFDSARHESQDGADFGASGGAAEEQARPDAAKDENSRDEALDEEFLKEMLGEEEAAGFIRGGETDEGDGTHGEKTAGADDEIAGLNARIAELEGQLAETREQLLRKAADFENFRKRMNLEKQKSIEFANETLLVDIIPTIDDFERAIASAELSPELAELPAGKAMLDGISMIERRFTGQLEGKWGLKRFASVGEPFDPNRHEAMLMEKSGDFAEPTVTEDFAKGYTLRDRVIRAAKVKVAMPGEVAGETGKTQG